MKQLTFNSKCNETRVKGFICHYSPPKLISSLIDLLITPHKYETRRTTNQIFLFPIMLS